MTETTRMDENNSWVTDLKGSCSILSLIGGKTFPFQQLFTTKPPKACTSSMLSPPSTVGFFSTPPHESLWESRRVGVAGLCIYYIVTNSGGDIRTTNLASGSFRCWLHPRCVYACMHLHEKDTCNPLKKTISLKMETPNKPQPAFLQESDLHTADLGEGGQRRKLWVVPTSAIPYSHSSRGCSASC